MSLNVQNPDRLSNSGRKLGLAPLMLGAALIFAPQIAAAATTDAGMASLKADVADAEGGSLGSVTLMETASGAVQIDLDLTGVPAGVHAVHIHETGECTAPDFKSSGGHLTGGKEHGAHSEGGMHSGDLPNIDVGEDGVAKFTFFSDNVTLDQVADEDGAAFVIHAGADDYVSQPSGDAGARIGCGVFSDAK